MKISLHPRDFFDAASDPALTWIFECQYPWEALAKLEAWIKSLCIDGPVHIGKGTVVEEGAVIQGPSFIGENCEIRAGAYIRGNVYVGNNSVVGHGTEVKHSILFPGVRADHFNYIRSSILGRGAHVGAGAVLASVKMPPSEIIVRYAEQSWPTSLEKFGAILGDGAEVGCNVVLNPGSILGKESVVYPLVSWRGVLPAGHIAKAASVVVLKTV